MQIELKSIVDEDFVNYKKPAMYIAFPYCSWKCEKDAGCEMCQNRGIASQKNILVDSYDIVKRYIDNPLTEAIIFSGLEPFDSYDQLLGLVKEFRQVTQDVIVIYTGYKQVELFWQLYELECYDNIIVKFGRFIPNETKVFDKLLGVYLASSNQHAVWISKNKAKENVELQRKRGFEVCIGWESKDINLPKPSTKYSAGNDFEAAESITILPYADCHKITLVPTGVKAYMQEDEALELYDRSSNPSKKGIMLANSVGIVDSDYYGNPDNDGHIMFGFINITDKPVIINKGDRIGQGIFKKFLRSDDSDVEIERSGGFGSTGE